MVLALLKPERVLELGAGWYSTPAILEAPSVKALVSLETDAAWRSQAANHTVKIVDNPASALPKSLKRYDLIFIDNEDSDQLDREGQRLEAIRAVLSRPYPPTIIHDAERYPITDYTDHLLVFEMHDLPSTAVCW